MCKLEEFEDYLDTKDYEYFANLQKKYDIITNIWEDYYSNVTKKIVEFDGFDNFQSYVDNGCFGGSTKFTQMCDYDALCRGLRNANTALFSSVALYLKRKYTELEDYNCYTFYTDKKSPQDITKITCGLVLNKIYVKTGFLPYKKESGNL